VPSQLSAQRIALFVDVQNIYYPAKSLGDKVNFHSLLKRFQTRQLVRAIAYVVEAPDVDVSPFVIALRNIGFEVRTKPMKVFDDGTRKGDIHLMLALDALSVASKVDVVCLVTGDGEYVDLVHLLRAQGVKVEIMSFKSNTSAELIRVSDEHFPMNEEFLLGFGAHGGRGDDRGGERQRASFVDDRNRGLAYRNANGREGRGGMHSRRDERYGSRTVREERSLRDDRGYRDERGLRNGRALTDDRNRSRSDDDDFASAEREDTAES
jgi:uncharacterized LabA/DUF88 family protein